MEADADGRPALEEEELADASTSEQEEAEAEADGSELGAEDSPSDAQPAPEQAEGQPSAPDTAREASISDRQPEHPGEPADALEDAAVSSWQPVGEPEDDAASQASSTIPTALEHPESAASAPAEECADGSSSEAETPRLGSQPHQQQSLADTPALEPQEEAQSAQDVSFADKATGAAAG